MLKNDYENEISYANGLNTIKGARLRLCEHRVH